MFKQLFLAVLLVLCGVFWAHGEIFKGDSFTVDLPAKPSMIRVSTINGPLGSVQAMTYEGGYKAPKIIISWSLETAKFPKSVFKNMTEEEIMDLLLTLHSQLAGKDKITKGVGDLKDSITFGGVGKDIYEKSPFGNFVTRIIVTKPRVWLLNIVGITGSKAEKKIISHILKTFTISGVGELARLYN